MRFGRHGSIAPVLLLIVALTLTTAASIPAAGQTENVLYGFQGGLDGAQPVAGLIDKAGNLFGTTAFGGSAGSGTVFKLTNSAGTWTETVLYSFQGGNDGAYPYSTLALDEDGNLYGTTLAGGTGCFVCGTVFRLSRRGGIWTETVLHSFSGLDGANPYGALLLDSAGNLFGTTYSGGTSFEGTVYKLTEQDGKPKGPWSETVLYNFTGEGDGGRPLSDLVRDKAGRLYGTTTGGGTDGFGVVFELTPPKFRGAPWTETAIHSFTGGNDGAEPYDGVAFDRRGSLVGAAALGGDPSCSGGGCGTIYKLIPPSTPGGAWSEDTLYAFTGGLDGAQPLAKPILDAKGNLYGTTSFDGTANPCYPYCGTVFELAPPRGSTLIWTETTLYGFAGGSDGSSPEASLLLGKLGSLYGTTVNGGDPGGGTVFEIVR